MNPKITLEQVEQCLEALLAAWKCNEVDSMVIITSGSTNSISQFFNSDFDAAEIQLRKLFTVGAALKCLFEDSDVTILAYNKVLELLHNRKAPTE